MGVVSVFADDVGGAGAVRSFSAPGSAAATAVRIALDVEAGLGRVVVIRA